MLSTFDEREMNEILTVFFDITHIHNQQQQKRNKIKRIVTVDKSNWNHMREYVQQVNDVCILVCDMLTCGLILNFKLNVIHN